MAVEDGNVNYDVNAIEALTEEAEALLQTTQARIVSTPVRAWVCVSSHLCPALLCFLAKAVHDGAWYTLFHWSSTSSPTQPVTVAAYGAAAAAAVVALINYHTVLQFVGVAGSLGLAINWFTNFDTPEVRVMQ